MITGGVFDACWSSFLMGTLRTQRSPGMAMSQSGAVPAVSSKGAALVLATALMVLVCADAEAIDYVLSLEPPLAEVNVYVDANFVGITDENGKIVISNTEPGSHEVRVEADGLDLSAEYFFDAVLNDLPPFQISPGEPPVTATARHIIETGVAGAMVFVNGSVVGITTGDGTAGVDLVPGRTYRISVDRQGYGPSEKLVRGMRGGGRLAFPMSKLGDTAKPTDPILIALVCVLGASLLLLVAVLVVQHRRRSVRSPGGSVEATEQGVGLFDRYRILSTLGSGGVGMIYRALDVVEKSTIALKVLDARWLGDPDMVRKFLSEGEVLRAVAAHDPENAVVRCFRHGREHGSMVGRPFISLELLEGETLQARLKLQPTLQELTAAGIAFQIASALKAVHAAGIVHRDLTPDNIFLKQGDVTIGGHVFAGVPRVVLIDFGIARVDIASKVTMDGSIAGKPQFMSPEQCRGLTVDARSDLYSLGIVMYLMAAGRTPFDGRDPFEVMRAQQMTAPPVLTTVSPQYLALTHKLLAKEVHARPQTADLVAAELETFFMYSEHAAASTNLVPFPERRLLP